MSCAGHKYMICNSRGAEHAAASCAAMALVLFALMGAAAGEGEPPRIESAENTVITSSRLDYDAQQRLALFDGNVVVRDPEINIATDRLRVAFDENNAVVLIEAEGNVVIKQEDTIGTGGKAVYHVSEGIIVLSEKPLVRRGSDELAGDTITLHRGTGRLICEPNAVLSLREAPRLGHLGMERK